jgi:hypothetical protein
MWKVSMELAPYGGYRFVSDDRKSAAERRSIIASRVAHCGFPFCAQAQEGMRAVRHRWHRTGLQVYECAVALSDEIETEDVVDGHLEETRRARKTTCGAAKTPAHPCRYLLRAR